MAVAFLFALAAHEARGASPAVCRESEVRLDSLHSAAKLEDCREGEAGSLLWHLDRIDQIGSVPDGRIDRGNQGTGSVIYVMDTGVRADHDEFAGRGSTRVIAGFDATGSVELGRSRCVSDNKALAPCFDNYDELPAASHGTSVASIAAGRHVGVAPGALVVSIRVMNERGLATTRTYVDGLDAVIRHAWSPSAPAIRTGIVNISGWVLERLSRGDGGEAVPFAEVEKKIRDMIAGVDAEGQRSADGKRFLFVVAANNVDGGCGSSGIIDRFPAILGPTIDGLITVGGMTASNTIWNGSCRGGVEVLGPAQGIFSATITDRDHYRGRRPNLRSGTSFAAPVISGIAARLLSDRPDLTPQQLEAWITSTPSRVYDADAQMAGGRVGYVRSIAPASMSSGGPLEP